MILSTRIFLVLVAALSGIPYRVGLSTFRDVLVTAFATGNQFVVTIGSGRCSSGLFHGICA
jgi:hypothetical protein